MKAAKQELPRPAVAQVVEAHTVMFQGMFVNPTISPGTGSSSDAPMNT